MADLFADTSGWGHLIDPSQPHHAIAARSYHDTRRRGDRVVTTSYVIAELVALLSSPIGMPRPLAITTIEKIKASSFVEILHIDPSLDDEGWQLLRRRPDKEWSLVDCVSFVVMTRRGLLEALTADRHFEQAGFVRLLK